MLTYTVAAICHGGAYRPRDVDLGNPAFYLLPLITVPPVTSWVIDRSR